MIPPDRPLGRGRSHPRAQSLEQSSRDLTVVREKRPTQSLNTTLCSMDHKLIGWDMLNLSYGGR